MIKKQYSAPEVKRVKLEIKVAILASCHQSPTNTDAKIGTTPCSIATGCYDPGLPYPPGS
jgi:hypothetical protein